MESLSIFYKIFLSIALGALMGIERERSQQRHKGEDFAGLRTFILICLFGTIGAYLSDFFFPWMIGILAVGFVLLVLVGYVMSAFYSKHVGMTTELSAVLAFFIGMLVYVAPQEVPILITIIITVLLSLKSSLHEFVQKMKSQEFYDTIKFIVIAFIILPLLKGIGDIGPYGAINLYEIWLMVVFVSGLSYIGYVLIKIYGARSGAMLTGILGGILSSTAVVTSLANKSKDQNPYPLAVAAAIACSTMFLRVLIEVAVLNFDLVTMLAFPMIVLTMLGFAFASRTWKKHWSDTKLEVSSPLLLRPALKFGLFFGFIRIISAVFLEVFGQKGLLLAGIISGLADVDAIALYIARNGIPIDIAVMTIMLAAIVNTAVKSGIGLIFGDKKYGVTLTKIMVPTIIVGLFFVGGM